MNLKKAIKKIPILGSTLIFLWGKVNDSAKKSTVFWLQKYLPDSPVMIVQIGSNDGKSDDPIYRLAQKNTQWRLLFVEPVPYLFDALKKNYGSSSRFLFANCAINDDGQSQPFYMINKQAFEDLPDLTPGHEQIGSFNKSHVVSLGGEKIEKYIDALEVNCKTLQHLFDDNNLNTIDALVIDAEGYDWKILRQLDLTRYHPRLIYFEYLNLNETEKKEAISTLSLDYHLFTFGINFMCIRKKHLENKDLKYLQSLSQFEIKN